MHDAWPMIWYEVNPHRWFHILDSLGIFDSLDTITIFIFPWQMLNALHITTRKRLIQSFKSPNSICPKITNWQKGTSVCSALRNVWSLFRCIKSWNPEIPAIRLWFGRLGSPTGHDWSLSRKLLTISFHFPIGTCNLMLSSPNCEISPCFGFGSFLLLANLQDNKQQTPSSQNDYL